MDNNIMGDERNLIVGAGVGERGRSRLESAEGASVLTIISL